MASNTLSLKNGSTTASGSKKRKLSTVESNPKKGIRDLRVKNEILLKNTETQKNQGQPSSGANSALNLNSRDQKIIDNIYEKMQEAVNLHDSDAIKNTIEALAHVQANSPKKNLSNSVLPVIANIDKEAEKARDVTTYSKTVLKVLAIKYGNLICFQPIIQKLIYVLYAYAIYKYLPGANKTHNITHSVGSNIRNITSAGVNGLVVGMCYNPLVNKKVMEPQNINAGSKALYTGTFSAMRHVNPEFI